MTSWVGWEAVVGDGRGRKEKRRYRRIPPTLKQQASYTHTRLGTSCDSCNSAQAIPQEDRADLLANPIIPPPIPSSELCFLTSALSTSALCQLWDYSPLPGLQIKRSERKAKEKFSPRILELTERGRESVLFLCCPENMNFFGNFAYENMQFKKLKI